VTRGPDRAVIVAGGGGTRLWPWTGPDLPKPLLPLGGGGRTLLAAGLDRLEGLVPPEAIALQAPADLGARLAAAEPRLRRGAVLDEPSARDTGPAIALAMRQLLAHAPEAVAAVLPADQRVADEPAFRAALAAAAEAARGGALVTLGVVPDHPSTRFGYVETGGAIGPGPARAVARFVEKPDRRAAERFLAGGRHLWNAGIFVWRADAFWAALERAAPELAAAVARFAGGDAAAWDAAPRASIDYALMERTGGVAVVPLDAGWDDVGSWDAAARLVGADRDLGRGVIRVDSPASAVFGGRRMIALVEAPHVVVVDTDDALLVVARDRTEKVRRVVEELRRRGRRDLL
jgi:mannose-1-phosphate guanylyltransferase/mannose-6-phosphate isomerase